MTITTGFKGTVTYHRPMLVEIGASLYPRALGKMCQDGSGDSDSCFVGAAAGIDCIDGNTAGSFCSPGLFAPSCLVGTGQGVG